MAHFHLLLYSPTPPLRLFRVARHSVGDGGDWTLDFSGEGDNYKNNFYSTEHVLKEIGGGIKLGAKTTTSGASCRL